MAVSRKVQWVCSGCVTTQRCSDLIRAEIHHQTREIQGGKSVLGFDSSIPLTVQED